MKSKATQPGNFENERTYCACVKSRNAVNLTDLFIGISGELRASESIRVNQERGSMEAQEGRLSLAWPESGQR